MRELPGVAVPAATYIAPPSATAEYPPKSWTSAAGRTSTVNPAPRSSSPIHCAISAVEPPVVAYATSTVIAHLRLSSTPAAPGAG
jgi:hypothetical protein